jgi:hypothetical protein
MRKAGLASGLRGDEVLIRLHQGAQKGDATNLGSLSEPRRKQNLYANPKRTAKFFKQHSFRRIRAGKVQTIFKKLFPIFPARHLLASFDSKNLYY